MLWVEKVNQEAAQALERVARVRDDDEVNLVQATRLKKGERVADDRAYVRLQVCGPKTGVHTGRAPDLDRENAKGSQESTRRVNRQHRGDQPPALFKSANGF